YDENVNAAYLNYESKFEKFDLTAALRAEQTIEKGNSVTLSQVVNSNYTDLFPHVLLTYKHDDKNYFSILFNRGIEGRIISSSTHFCIMLTGMIIDRETPI